MTSFRVFSNTAFASMSLATRVTLSMPRNESAYTVMSGGWKKVIRQLDEISGEDS